MIDAIINSFRIDVKEKFEELSVELETSLDFTLIEREISSILNELSASILKQLLNNLLQKDEFLKLLKQIAGNCGMHFVRYREVEVHCGNGQIIKILSPYFVKARSKKRKKKQKSGPQGKGHLGLSVLGFIGFCSGNFVSYVVKLAVLCPSFMVAQEVLSEQNINIDVKTIRRLCRDLGIVGLEFRGAISLDGSEDLSGHTLVIGIDGGRLRLRKPKRGRRKKGQKRQGYHTDWKEPKLFTIYLLDNKGQIVKKFKPLHDATMENYKDTFKLLEQYLNVLDLTSVSRVVFSGDGDPTIWSGIENICSKLNIDSEKIYQVLDYTHAKQNLKEITDLISIKLNKRDKIAKEWKSLLWNGDIQGLYNGICKILKNKKKTQGLKKWRNYFKKNSKRMQYQTFKTNGIPTGSGCVESAIRRVINLRLKSAGSFWKKDMAEYFLFLRAQLLSGRWQIFIKNVTRRFLTTLMICKSFSIAEKNISCFNSYKLTKISNKNMTIDNAIFNEIGNKINAADGYYEEEGNVA